MGCGFVKIGPTAFPGQNLYRLLMHTVPGLDLFCFARASFFQFVFCVPDVCSVLFPCFSLSVHVHSMDWKDLSPI